MEATPGMKIEKPVNNSFKKEIIKNKYLYLLTLPAIIFYLVFAYLPMVGGFIIPFKDFMPSKGILRSPFVGFQNFSFFLSSDDWVRVTANTLFLNLLFVSIGLFTQIAISIMLSEIASKYFKKLAQTFMLFPFFISWTVVSMMALALFSTNEGFINIVLKSFGGAPVSFYQEPGIWPILLVLFKSWKSLGYGTVVYLANIAGIDQELYEAARIDGANRFQMIFGITLPMLVNTTVLLFIMAIGSIFYGDFGMIYALVGDNALLFPTTDIIDTFVFRTLRFNSDFGMAAAVGLLQSVMGFVMVLGSNLLIRRVRKEAALF